ncbi:tol-pal system-associated acyl-CoA thioesterase [Candidatus Endobugula sertula]|uniref:Tol-pal system-associated acyl-CoA thioesterase n=1 Tax=Candidatus Endobugula sertula TaxID=62101 RepID=A0A1D2QM00_9GAMM|nr:tol-pal system-associated acyl-CoA thioesterase [Candidatus Endobugula sertula]
MCTEFQLPIRVYIEDTDAGGIVYYVNYLKFMERSRTELLRSLGYGKAAILEDGLLLVVHSLDTHYLAPAMLDDELVVTACMDKVARSYVVFEQEVRRGTQVLCRGNVKVACVNTAMKPTALPVYIYEAMINSCP